MCSIKFSSIQTPLILHFYRGLLDIEIKQTSNCTRIKIMSWNEVLKKVY